MNQVDFNDLSQNLLFRYNQQKDDSTFFYFPIPIKTNVPPKNDESESFIKTAQIINI